MGYLDKAEITYIYVEISFQVFIEYEIWETTYTRFS